MVEVARCEVCVDEIRTRCDSYLAENVTTMAMIYSLEADELAIVESDPSVEESQRVAIREAAQIESVHLADYKATVLTGELALLGCSLDEVQIKNNLIARVVGK